MPEKREKRTYEVVHFTRQWIEDSHNPRPEELEWVTVEGRPVKVPGGERWEFFVARAAWFPGVNRTYRWVVSEVSSTAIVGRGNTQEEAIEAAAAAIAGHGPDATDRAIRHWQRITRRVPKSQAGQTELDWEGIARKACGRLLGQLQERTNA